MCGLGPTMAVLYALADLGPRQATLVRYMTSCDVDGRRDQVVGYGGVIIT